jgi:hypothetical protein
MKIKIISSIYTKKFTLENLKNRTISVSATFKLIYLINNKLNENKSGTTDPNLVLSR